MATCTACHNEVQPVTPSEGTDVDVRVGWWCDNCDALFPDGDYVSMRVSPPDDWP